MLRGVGQEPADTADRAAEERGRSRRSYHVWTAVVAVPRDRPVLTGYRSVCQTAPAAVRLMLKFLSSPASAHSSSFHTRPRVIIRPFYYLRTVTTALVEQLQGRHALPQITMRSQNVSSSSVRLAASNRWVLCDSGGDSSDGMGPGREAERIPQGSQFRVNAWLQYRVID
ncbi:hypothetical protein DPEC_G00088390 [Dallia pectoralis]|uniref:Uncharacterized protein n=1 Tax=Dallia pectoralis TaxID=75939 RepID=A0ACC2H0T3_DALPE|nr:hypothetical protein DPEC_G00088390 [Dallia pectoralis]